MSDKIDLNNIKTYSLFDRPSKVSLGNLGHPDSTVEFGDFLNTLPESGKAKDLLELAEAVLHARMKDFPVILMMGAHPVKCGLSPFISAMISEGWITHLALNGAGVIHDVEMALCGNTSEDVAEALKDGSFGMARETGEFIMDAIGDGFSGFGSAVGDAILAMESKDNESSRENESSQSGSAVSDSSSILAACSRWGASVSVHVALGTDIIHVHPSFKPESVGRASYEDFKTFIGSVSEMCGGGVVLNLGSAVILPEVFLKALSAARNLGHQVKDFTAANMDQIMHYRSMTNVVRRPVMEGGRGLSITGHHEIMLPLLYSTICTMAGKQVKK